MKALASILTALGAAVALSAQPLNFVFESEIDTQAEVNAIRTDLLDNGVTASTTQSAAGGYAVTDQITRVTVVANDGDALTMPELSTLTPGDTYLIFNDDAAQYIQLFPASGDDIGAGTDTALQVQAGEYVSLIVLDAATAKTLIAARERDWFQVDLAPSGTDMTTGTSKARFIVPYDFTVTSVQVEVAVAPVGSTAAFDINEGGVSMFSTVITIDASETSSLTAATAAVISDAVWDAGDIITVDIDQIGSGTAGQWPVLLVKGYLR